MDIQVRILGEVAVFDVAGDFMRRECPIPTLLDLVGIQLEKGKRKILFNFDKVGFMDSFGIEQLLAIYTSIQNLGGGFKLCCVPKKIIMVLTVVGFIPRVFIAYADEAAALESFANPSAPNDPTNLKT